MRNMYRRIPFINMTDFLEIPDVKHFIARCEEAIADPDHYPNVHSILISDEPDDPQAHVTHLYQKQILQYLSNKYPALTIHYASYLEDEHGNNQPYPKHHTHIIIQLYGGREEEW